MEWRKREEWSGRWEVVDLSEIGGKAGYYGRAGTAASRLARESRIFREPCGGGAGIQKLQSMARKFGEDRKRLIYKYICRKMIYFAIKTA